MTKRQARLIAQRVLRNKREMAHLSKMINALRAGAYELDCLLYAVGGRIEEGKGWREIGDGLDKVLDEMEMQRAVEREED